MTIGEVARKRGRKSGLSAFVAPSPRNSSSALFTKLSGHSNNFSSVAAAAVRAKGTCWPPLCVRVCNSTSEEEKRVAPLRSGGNLSLGSLGVWRAGLIQEVVARETEIRKEEWRAAGSSLSLCMFASGGLGQVDARMLPTPHPFIPLATLLRSRFSVSLARLVTQGETRPQIAISILMFYLTPRVWLTGGTSNGDCHGEEGICKFGAERRSTRFYDQFYCLIFLEISGSSFFSLLALLIDTRQGLLLLVFPFRSASCSSFYFSSPSSVLFCAMCGSLPTALRPRVVQ